MKFENLNGGQELICINVDKVYDWVLKEKSFDLSLSGANAIITFDTTLDLTAALLANATVTCRVTADPDISDTREDISLTIDGTPVTLQRVAIVKNFVVTIIVTLANGTVITSSPSIGGVNPGLLFSRCEQVILCAPVGTEIALTTDIDCFVCQTGALTPADPADDTITFGALTISLVTCQSIQSTFPVTVEFLAEFCEPREDISTDCPPPSRPLQCPVVFPDFG